MRKIISLLILISFLSCDNASTHLPKSFKDTSEFKVSFLEKKVRLPNNYSKVTVDEWIRELDSIENRSLVSDVQPEDLKHFENLGIEMDLFIEKNNPQNYITFMLGNYVFLDKDLLNAYTNMLESQMKQRYGNLGLGYERLESKYIAIKNTRSIKVKFKQLDSVNKKYITQYIITIGMKTFSMNVVSNDVDEDYQRLLKNFESI